VLVASRHKHKRYQVDLGALMAACETNYWRLRKLLLPEFPHFACGEVIVFALPALNRQSERYLRLRIVERCTYTTTLELSEVISDDNASRWGLSPQLAVRIYHDAKTAEVIAFQHQRHFHGHYEYPNPQMRQQDEKFQLNSLLAEWLHHCLQYGYRQQHGVTASCTMPVLLYIHGFNSSPQSHKASALRAWLAQKHPHIHCEIPYLKPYPAESIAQLEQIVESSLAKNEPIALMGSSLGGYYAASLAGKYNLRAVLVNPSVRPFELLGKYIGENKNFYNNDHYLFEQKHVDELKAFYVPAHRHPDNLLLMVQTGDEALDFREATAKYVSSQNIIEYGGDHSFSNVERWFDYTLHFLKLLP